MRYKMNTIAQVINKQNPAINLPRSSIHDAYILDCKVTIKNNTAASVTPTITQVLTALDQVVVTSDSSTVHYSWTGLDVARRNAMFVSDDCTSKVINKVLPAIGAGNSDTISFTLMLEEGDIIAVMHDALELKCVWLPTIANNVEITEAVIRTTIMEKIPTGEEVISLYGDNFEYVAEPKVYAIKQDCAGGSDFTGVIDLPTGTMLTGAMMHFSAAPELVGIMQNVPDRVELEKVSFDVLRAIDERKYKTDLPENVIAIDYGTHWMTNGIGKPGWKFNKGDIQVAVKTAEPTTLRYISFERVVNTKAFDAAGFAQIGGSFV